ncbi:MAG: GGDEF domain-containing protein [Oscillospiraceae bacterium]|nr:GGDEF domain-containing protein [Oscillospiraceae bacterium]
MFNCKKPIGRTIMAYGSISVIVLCILTSLHSGGILDAAVTRRYISHLQSVLTYVEHVVDKDDLRDCLQSGQPSEKYVQLQQSLNYMVDDFELEYLYIMIPVDDGRGTVMNVCSATSAAERAAGEEDYPLRYTLPEGWYTAEQLKPYINAYNKVGEFTTFKAESDEFVTTRTVCKPLVASDGTKIGLLCADIALRGMRRNINLYVLGNAGVAILFFLVVASIGEHWLHKNITGPILTLEERTREFAENSRGKRDMSALTFNTPDIHTQNEIESLNDAITQMSEDMKHYVEDILATEKRVESAENEIADLSRIAYRDSLTKAMSRVAYDEKKAEMTKAINAGEQEDFGLIAVNLMDAKRIDDIYGNEAGQKYIISGYEIIRSVFPYSQIYRVIDHDFVVLLEGEAYIQRDELYKKLQKLFHEAQEDPQREPWDRCAAVSGMTEFIKGADESADQVSRRVQMILFRNKRIISQSGS